MQRNLKLRDLLVLALTVLLALPAAAPAFLPPEPTIDEVVPDLVTWTDLSSDAPAALSTVTVKLVDSVTHAGTTHHVYQQVIGDVPVYGCTVRVHEPGDGTPLCVTEEVAAVTAVVPSEPKLSRQAAEDAAVQDLGTDPATVRTATPVDLTYLPLRSGTVLAWQVRVAAAKPLGDWEVLVDAATGAVLGRTNHMRFLETGRGDVYPTNPLDGPPADRPLNDMAALTALVGPYVKTVNDDGPGASDESGVYRYQPDDTHFDEVMIYHHLNVIHDYYKSTHGFTGLDKQMKATVHYGTNYDNAFFSPWEGSVSFGDGKRLNDLAKEAAIAYHEYTHASTNAIVRLAYKDESGAMDEGMADFFACLLTDDPELGEWTVQKLGWPYLRNLEEKLHYPEDIHGEVHADGKIWGCLLWDLKLALGTDVAAALVHKSRYYLSYRAKFVNGLKALLEADKRLFGGEHAATVTDVAARRGVTVPAAAVDRQSRFIRLHGE